MDGGWGIGLEEQLRDWSRLGGVGWVDRFLFLTTAVPPCSSRFSLPPAPPCQPSFHAASPVDPALLFSPLLMSKNLCYMARRANLFLLPPAQAVMQRLWGLAREGGGWARGGSTWWDTFFFFYLHPPSFRAVDWREGERRARCLYYPRYSRTSGFLCMHCAAAQPEPVLLFLRLILPGIQVAL